MSNWWRINIVRWSRGDGMRPLQLTLWAILTIVVAGAPLLAADQAIAADASSRHMRIPATSNNQYPDVIRLGLNKSIIIDLPRAAKDVLVSSPKKADAVMRTPRRAYVIGMEVGQTNIFFFDESGQQILGLELQIEQDLAALNSLYHRLLPDARITVDAMNDNVILTGSAKSNSDAAQAVELAARFTGDPLKVVNMLAIEGKDQVLLKVTIAEVQRTAAKQLGIDFDALVNETGRAVFRVVSDNPFGVAGSPLSTTRAVAGYFDGDTSITAAVRALERNGVLRTLAEPTLAAISGESASFLAGGEFPIPVSQDDSGITVTYKPFGVSLAFTPVVLSDGRISLKVKTEVSEPTSQGAFAIGGGNAGANISIPGLKVRRADTTVEMPSGGSLIIAGLIQEDTRQGLSGVPGAKDLPVLGTLFRSRDFQNNDTEMMVLVTPYLAEPTARKNLSLPTDRLAAPGDIGANFFGKINRIYGTSGSEPAGSYQGRYGFIVQ